MSCTVDQISVLFFFHHYVSLSDKCICWVSCDPLMKTLDSSLWILLLANTRSIFLVFKLLVFSALIYLEMALNFFSVLKCLHSVRIIECFC